MDRMLYLAMSGASHAMKAQAVNANNLANVNTTSFRADLAAFQSIPVEGAGLESRVYSVARDNGVDLGAGPTITTGRELDVAINGDGWFAIQRNDGSEGFTRAGNFRITSFGQLETDRGQPVLGNSGLPVIIPPAEKIEIASDGTVSARPVGQTAATLVVVDRLKMVNPDPATMQKGSDGVMTLKDGTISVADASVTLSSGVLEGSNVNAIESMVSMIALSRQFEMGVKMMKSAEENDKASAQLLRAS
ncbi:MAG TPA: flagellar basal-body rod protein FlgF [Chromatiales bacterium]|nr:flagellar basal-body rod protein FlgF [Chromatiales bacterium]